MNEISSGLQDLHLYHSEIQKVRDEIDRGPRQIRVRKRMMETKEAEIAEFKTKLMNTRKSTDEKSLQLKSNEAKIAQLQVKLNQANNQREFDALKSQIGADAMANSVLEDEILEGLDRIDNLQANIKAAEKEKAELNTAVKTFADEVAAKEEGLKANLARLEQALAQAEKILPASVLPDYRRLVQAHGASALAPLDHKACSSCSTTVAPQQAIDLRAGKFTFCRTCGRLLYQVE